MLTSVTSEYYNASMDKIILWLHIAGGALALGAMPLALLSAKGRSLHRAAGKIFVVGMAVVSVSAIRLGVLMWLSADVRTHAFGAFLLFISVFTGNLVSVGIRALRTRRREGRGSAWDIGLAAASVAATCAAFAYGLSTDERLFTGFGAFATPISAWYLVYWLLPPRGKVHHILQHVTAMLGGCIAAVTAFTVVNAPRLGLGRGTPILWAAPAAVFLPMMIFYIWRTVAGHIPSARLAG
jgi:uncharacterized membrane protein